MAKMKWDKSSGRGMGVMGGDGFCYHYRKQKITPFQRNTKFLYCRVINCVFYNNAVLVKVQLVKKIMIVLAWGEHWIKPLKEDLKNNRVIAINTKSACVKINGIKRDVLILKHIKFE